MLYAGEIGQYYGVQGTTWKAAPILDNPTDEVRMRKRTYRRYFDGKKIRLIAWETPRAVYWVSNTPAAEAHEPPDDGRRSLARADALTLAGVVAAPRRPDRVAAA